MALLVVAIFAAVRLSTGQGTAPGWLHAVYSRAVKILISSVWSDFVP